MLLDGAAVERYLTRLHGQPVQLNTIQELSGAPVKAGSHGSSDTRTLKTFGYGKPVLVRYQIDDDEHLVVLHTALADQFGHDHRADRAAAILLDYDTFNTLPRHVAALDVGIFVNDAHPIDSAPLTQSDGQHLLSLKGGSEFFLLAEYVDGRPYADDLQRLCDGGELQASDLHRAGELATTLAQIHAVKWPVQGDRDPSTCCVENRDSLYRRRIRDTIGSGEGIMGLIDSYPLDLGFVSPQWLMAIEQACIEWRWRLRNRTDRLSQVHGDFHPFNILFTPQGECRFVDRSRGAWGEPADDVTCLAINYLFFSLQRSGSLAPPFSALWDLFWQTYLDLSGDEDLLRIGAPFLVWRALVLADPVWYNVQNPVRYTLLRFIDRIVHEELFDPSDVNSLLSP